ncbi:hypothetical protein B0T24DRAFT_306168 [Lasiosphaeria ovina]|uniref:Uncharacterized protein n=1 Tax=Lasiosphaeria ovina TaxID=92902 RepID=A0AAE0K872_9PEZI|nr:hypothetical protein B0T24DRAFT_306168 [Lasiosphaeria ovina]
MIETSQDTRERKRENSFPFKEEKAAGDGTARLPGDNNLPCTLQYCRTWGRGRGKKKKRALSVASTRNLFLWFSLSAGTRITTRSMARGIRSAAGAWAAGSCFGPGQGPQPHSRAHRGSELQRTEVLSRTAGHGSVTPLAEPLRQAAAACPRPSVQAIGRSDGNVLLRARHLGGPWLAANLPIKKECLNRMAWMDGWMELS